MAKFKDSGIQKIVSVDYKDTEALWRNLFADLHEAKEIQKKTYFERQYLKVFLVEVESLISNYKRFMKIKGIDDEIKKFDIARKKFFHWQFQECHSKFLHHVTEYKVPLTQKLKRLYNEEYDNIRKILIEVFTLINEKLLELLIEMTETEKEKTFDDEADPIKRQIKLARWRMNKSE